MVYFKLMMVNGLLMMVKCSSMMVKWVYDHTLISPSLTSILPSLAWSKPSFAHLILIEKLHRLPYLGGGSTPLPLKKLNKTIFCIITPSLSTGVQVLMEYLWKEFFGRPPYTLSAKHKGLNNVNITFLSLISHFYHKCSW